MSYGLGIDVGNTYVTAAVATATGIEMFTFGGRAVVTPATVHLRHKGAPATGEAASSPAGSNLDPIGGGFMSRLGNQEPVVIGGAPYPVTDLLGILVNNVLQEVTKAHGVPPDRVVLTHPASWDPIRRALFKEAARRAGLHDAFVVTEPEAAATYYDASQQWNDGDTVAVYDLGASTFNATVLLKTAGGIHILGEPERVAHPGVKDVSAKDVSAKDFDDEVVRSQLEPTISTLYQALRSAQVEPADLSAVLLVGGSSSIPLVAQMVSAELGCPTVMDPHPQRVIALGAAMLAAHAVHADRFQRGERHDEVQQEGQRLAGNGAITSTLTAKTEVDAGPKRDTPGIPTQRAAVTIPARTPPQEAPPTAACTASGTSDTGPNVLTVQIPAPAVTPRPARPPRLPATPTPDIRRAGAPKQRATANRGTRPQALIISGMAIGAMAAALAGSILLALYGGKSNTQVPALAQPTISDSVAVANPAPDLAIPAVAATIPLKDRPTFVTVSPHAKYAYVAHADTQTVTVVDTADKRVVATISIAAGPPQFLALAPDGRKLYVSIFNDQRTIHAIDVLDTGSNTVVATIPQPSRPYLPAVSPDGKRLYVPNHDVAAVSVIDTATEAIIAQIQVPPNPHWIDFSPDGSRAYTANHESNLVSSIDTTTLRVLTTIPVGISPHSVAVNPHRPLVVNVNFDSASVTMIDTITQKVVATIPVGQNPQAIAWAPDGRFAYAVNQGSNTVSVIDSTTKQVTTTIPTGAGPTSIALLPNSHQAYISDTEGKTLTVLDLAR